MNCVVKNDYIYLKLLLSCHPLEFFLAIKYFLSFYTENVHKTRKILSFQIHFCYVKPHINNTTEDGAA